MKYSLDFPEHVQKVAIAYLDKYKSGHEVRDKHKEFMNFLDQLGKEVKVFKEIASCIDTLLWMEDQPEDL
jgi:hypothetical protein